MLGVSLGLAAGMSPGPLLTYTIVATLRGGGKAGVAVGMAPLLTDIPIILLSLWILHQVPEQVVHLLGIAGGLFVIYLGWETARSAQKAPALALDTEVDVSQALGRGILVNFLNPNPYIFWATVGGPILVRAYRETPVYAAAFLVAFYTLLVGAHVAIALFVHRQRDALQGGWYRRALFLLAVLLITVGIRLIVENGTAIGW